jgi:hypothetical protein
MDGVQEEDMKRDSIIMFVGGIVFAFMIFMLISAGGDASGGEIGRYQIAVGGDDGKCYITDTKTGVVKGVVVPYKKVNQLGIPFEEIKDK